MEEGQVTLSDGRKLGFVESGPPQGLPIFYFHGFPGSRNEAELLLGDSSASEWRIIAVDRPGMGLSDFQPNRTLKDWPHDIGELADRLGIGRFSIIGVSGGGPYAAVCAWGLPDRVIGAGIACGVGDLDHHESDFSHGSGSRATLRLLHSFPGLSKPTYAVCGFILKHWPLMMLDSHLPSLPRCERAVLVQPAVRQALSRSFRESVRQGSAGGAQELKILCNPWSFNLGEIRIPMALWHGELDAIVPVLMGRHVASQIPRCRASFFPDDGHYSLLVNRRAAIMGDLRKIVQEETWLRRTISEKPE